MTGTWHHLPAPARAVAVAASDAVAAAQRRDRDAFAVAVRRLAELDPQRTGPVLGRTVRLLLEQLHPDGVAADDVRALLQRCVRAATEWQPDVDPHVVLVVLTGALGIHELDGDVPPPRPDELARHAALLLAVLVPEQRRPLDGYLAGAFADIQRAELHD